jgi:glyoxylase-like metal-dependent hydrolase (beta-lactamase superfamily II)
MSKDGIVSYRGLGSQNSYLITSGEEHFLVDIGWPKTARQILKRRSSFNLIVVTHRHYDHFGCARLVSQKTSTPIAAYRRVKNKFIELPPFWQAAPYLLKSWIKQGFFLPQLTDLKIDKQLIRVDRILKDEQFINKRRSWQVLHTPGHTSDSISLYCKKQGLLLAGDLLNNQFDSPHWGRLITDYSAFLKTKTLLSKLDIKVVYPGHGQPFKLFRRLKKQLFE